MFRVDLTIGIGPPHLPNHFESSNAQFCAIVAKIERCKVKNLCILSEEEDKISIIHSIRLESTTEIICISFII